MKKYMKNHESYLREQLAEAKEDRSETKTGENLSGLLEYHRQGEGGIIVNITSISVKN